MRDPHDARLHQEVADRYGTRIEEVPAFGSAGPVLRIVYRLGWSAWLFATAVLAALDIPHATMCETAKDVGEVVAEFNEAGAAPIEEQERTPTTA